MQEQAIKHYKDINQYFTKDAIFVVPITGTYFMQELQLSTVKAMIETQGFTAYIERHNYRSDTHQIRFER